MNKIYRGKIFRMGEIILHFAIPNTVDKVKGKTIPVTGREGP
jgi:hypothetical protein